MYSSFQFKSDVKIADQGHFFMTLHSRSNRDNHSIRNYLHIPRAMQEPRAVAKRYRGCRDDGREVKKKERERKRERKEKNEECNKLRNIIGLSYGRGCVVPWFDLRSREVVSFEA